MIVYVATGSTLNFTLAVLSRPYFLSKQYRHVSYLNYFSQMLSSSASSKVIYRSQIQVTFKTALTVYAAANSPLNDDSDWAIPAQTDQCRHR